ncbi:hypothetical protein [Pseudonocardia adelaidensis]|uniref:Immunity protein 50 of polymorphic toxin system n=1 Tax=Pseudonocardia adelaidensis TaxID=648754 RepID=A0ABP9NPF0_9PSEU
MTWQEVEPFEKGEFLFAVAQFESRPIPPDVAALRATIYVVDRRPWGRAGRAPCCLELQVQASATPGRGWPEYVDICLSADFSSVARGGSVPGVSISRRGG